MLNGSENWSNGTSGGYYRYYLSLENANASSSRSICLSNYFNYISSGNSASGCFISSANLFLYPEQTISTTNDFKTWLSTHNTIVYYPLATPTLIDTGKNIDIPLYNGTNNISNSENAIMTISYVRND